MPTKIGIFLLILHVTSGDVDVDDDVDDEFNGKVIIRGKSSTLHYTRHVNLYIVCTNVIHSLTTYFYTLLSFIHVRT